MPREPPGSLAYLTLGKPLPISGPWFLHLPKEWMHKYDRSACMHAKSLQSYLTLCDPMDCKPPGSSVHGILHALLQGIFPTQALNSHLLHPLHGQTGSLPPAPPGKPLISQGPSHYKCPALRSSLLPVEEISLQFTLLESRKTGLASSLFSPNLELTPTHVIF